MPPPVGCGHARGLEAARVCATEATSRARRLTPAPSPTTTTRGHGVEDGAVCGGDARRGAASPPPPMGGCRASPVWARGILLGPDLRSSAPCSSLLAPAPGDAHTAAGHRARARYGLGGGCSPWGVATIDLKTPERGHHTLFLSHCLPHEGGNSHDDRS